VNASEPREVRIVLMGDPVPWATPGFDPRSGRRFVHKRQERATKAIAKAVEERGIEPFPAGVPLEMSAIFWVPRPKYHYGTGRNASRIKPQYVGLRPVGKPDLTNLLKLLEDGLHHGGLFPDDKQIVGLYEPFGEWYTLSPDDPPRSVVRIREAL
jgi:Holliday junction resolvase RusA-like endonuclease